MDENTRMFISQGLNVVATALLESYARVDEYKKKFQEEDESKQTMWTLTWKKVKEFLKSNAQRQADLKYKEQQEAFEVLYALERKVVRRIKNITDDPDISEEKLRGIENELTSLEAAFKARVTKDYFNEDIFRLRFMFPDFARESIQPLLGKPSDKSAFFYTKAYQALLDNAKRYADLSKLLMHKMAEVYRIDVERGRKEGRKKFASMMAMGIPWSATAECRMRIEQLGRALSWTKEQAYEFVGLSYEEAEAEQKEWGEKVKFIHDTEGLYKEFCD